MPDRLSVDPTWRIEMLGGLRAISGDRVVTRFRSHKTAALLAYLAFYLQRSHPRDLLTDLLWPQDDLDAARMKLRTALASLRRQLEPPLLQHGAVIVATRLAVRLNPTAVVTDAAQFEAALHAAADAQSIDEQVRRLDTAIALYRGPLLPGHFEPWVLPEQQRLGELFIQALHRLVERLERAGDLQRALGYAGRAVAADPLREEAHHELIRLYAAAGQPAAARRQYRELERLLHDELGETPSPATRALVDGIREHAPTLPVGRSPLVLRSPADASRRKIMGQNQKSEEEAQADDSTAAAPTSFSAPAPSAPPQVTEAPGPHPITPRLPLPLTRFFGREAEIARVRRLLLTEGVRLATLTGPGGSGKTRLALEAAARLREALDGAVWFVAAADLSDPHRLIDAIHTALALPRLPQAEPLEQVVELLSRRPSLLVLDNFEHLMPDGCPIVRDLLERIPMLQCLITSRQILELTPEREIAVGPLPVPGVQKRPDSGQDTGRLNAERLNALLACESVALFVDRAQRVSPDFQLTGSNEPAVADLCRRLEGIPLAIELAAARAQRLSPSRMVAELERRFDLLVSRKRDLPSRHRTLRAAIDRSYQLLSPGDDPDPYACVGQRAPVWFLVYNSTASGTHNLRIPGGEAIFFAPVSAVATRQPGVWTDADLAGRPAPKVQGYIDSVTTMEVSLDGVPVSNVKQYRIRTPLFNVTIPPDNVFGAPVSTVEDQRRAAIADGYWLLFPPLPVGKHVLASHVAGTSDLDGNPFEARVTLNLNIEKPNDPSQ